MLRKRTLRAPRSAVSAKNVVERGNRAVGGRDPRRAPADEDLGAAFFRGVERFVEQRDFARTISKLTKSKQARAAACCRSRTKHALDRGTGRLFLDFERDLGLPRTD